MYKEQAHIIIRLLIFLDALFVILAAYGGYYLRVLIHGTPPKLDEKIFALSVLVIMVVNNYAANKLGLYSDKKLKSYLSLIWKIFECIVFDFIVLGCVIFIIKEQHYLKLEKQLN